MARMLGRKVWDRVFCACCNGPRSVKAERAREKRQFARELLPEGELDVATDIWRDCRHGCDGECLTSGGPDACVYTCHPGKLLDDVDVKRALSSLQMSR